MPAAGCNLCWLVKNAGAEQYTCPGLCCVGGCATGGRVVEPRAVIVLVSKKPLFVVTDPFLNLFRGLGLNFGGLDFSILPAFFLLNALTNAVPALGADASFLVDPSALM